MGIAFYPPSINKNKKVVFYKVTFCAPNMFGLFVLELNNCRYMSKLQKL